jgi:cellobiose-specific phosphotransferase system component IIA
VVKNGAFEKTRSSLWDKAKNFIFEGHFQDLKLLEGQFTGHPSDSTLWLFHIAMGNGPFIDDLPIKNDDFPWLC